MHAEPLGDGEGEQASQALCEITAGVVLEGRLHFSFLFATCLLRRPLLLSSIEASELEVRTIDIIADPYIRLSS
jgi:hypothetical protein